VSSDLGEETATARQVVLSTEPDDDAGADTADRYEWQAAMAAADGLALYFDAIVRGARGDGNTGIVCEHHEDWVLVRSVRPSWSQPSTVSPLLERSRRSRSCSGTEAWRTCSGAGMP
jgi:hypothetical protein